MNNVELMIYFTVFNRQISNNHTEDYMKDITDIGKFNFC